MSFSAKYGHTHNVQRQNWIYTVHVLLLQIKFKGNIFAIAGCFYYFFMFLHKCYGLLIFRPPFEKQPISQLLQFNLLKHTELF